MMYEELFIKLSNANDLYRAGKDTGITDLDYDQLVIKLKLMEESLHPSERLGYLLENPFKTEINSGWSIKHQGISQVAMNQQEMEDIVKDLHAKEFVCMPKYDGLTILAYYTKGKFVKAFTGGRKGVSIDVSRMFIVTCGNEYLTIDTQDEVCLVGEVLLTLENAKKYGYRSARSAASGIIQTLDESNNDKKLQFSVFNMIERKATQTHKNFATKLKYISTLVKNCTTFSVLSSAQEISNYFANFSHTNTDVQLDGIVVRDNQSENIFKYKFVEHEHIVKILDIIHQVGRSRITPVLTTEDFTGSDGSINNSVTAHNYVIWKELEIGDSIAVIKSGAVISKILRKV